MRHPLGSRRHSEVRRDVRPLISALKGVDGGGESGVARHGAGRVELYVSGKRTKQGLIASR